MMLAFSAGGMKDFDRVGWIGYTQTIVHTVVI